MTKLKAKPNAKAKEYLNNKFKGHDLSFFKDVLDENLLDSSKDVDIISIFIYSRINVKILDSLKNLFVTIKEIVL